MYIDCLSIDFAVQWQSVCLVTALLDERVMVGSVTRQANAAFTCDWYRQRRKLWLIPPKDEKHKVHQSLWLHLWLIPPKVEIHQSTGTVSLTSPSKHISNMKMIIYGDWQYHCSPSFMLLWGQCLMHLKVHPGEAFCVFVSDIYIYICTTVCHTCGAYIYGAVWHISYGCLCGAMPQAMTYGAVCAAEGKLWRTGSHPCTIPSIPPSTLT